MFFVRAFYNSNRRETGSNRKHGDLRQSPSFPYINIFHWSNMHNGRIANTPKFLLTEDCTTLGSTLCIMPSVGFDRCIPMYPPLQFHRRQLFSQNILCTPPVHDFLLASPQTPLMSFPVLIYIFAFLRSHTVGISWCVVLSDWLFSLGNMHLKSCYIGP